MSGPATPDADRATAMQAACVAALAGAHWFALGAVRAGVLVHASTALRRMFALPPDAVAMQFTRLVAPDDRARVMQALAAAVETPLPFRALRADTGLFEAELSTVAAALPDGPATVIAVFDLTEREYAARSLSYLEFVDPPSGLPNERAFLARLQAALGAARRADRPLAAMLIALDESGARGAAAQGADLRSLSARLRLSLRETDTLARLGPAELGVLLPRLTDCAHAELPAARMLAALAEQPAQGSPGARTSIGIACYPAHAAAAEPLLERARAAAADALHGGGNRFAFASPGAAAVAPAPAYLPWNPRYAVGIEVMDGQHRELLECINRLAEGLRSGRDFDELVEALRELVRYTEHHFATEERLMDEHGAHAERHRGEHRRLLDDLMRFALRRDAQGLSQSAAFLQDWLFRHIDEVDRPFAAFLRNHGQR